MACSNCACEPEETSGDRRWRRALWIALAVNGGMFDVEIAAGIASQSRALQADALDFLSDAANYAISLAVAGMTLSWRAHAAFLKGATLVSLGLYVIVTTVWDAFNASAPKPEIMGFVGAAALIANGSVVLMLYRFRSGDANMRSVWICSRNDVIGNAAVLLAALGVFGTGTVWPDLIVAAIMAALAVSGGVQIVTHARKDISSTRRGKPLPWTALALPLALSLVGQQVRAEDRTEEPSALFEVGAAGEWSSREKPGFGPSLGLEVEPIDQWLEIEVGTAALFRKGSAELETDLLFKKPFTLNDTVEFMIGLGPSWNHGIRGAESGDTFGIEAAGDFMVWPWRGRRIGWYAEPSYGYSFARNHERTLGMSVGLIIPLP